MIEREHVGIFGKMNSGKSSTMNLLTGQETSIVDEKPGTTADTKIALLEIHGLGPVKIFDTPGADEEGHLGIKKKEKMIDDLKKSDLVLVVINPDNESFDIEKEIVEKARKDDKQVLIIYNIFNEKDFSKVESEIPVLKFYKKIEIKANNVSNRQRLLNFILDNYEAKNKKIELFPFLEKDEFYVLIIPMDSETPPGRFLRPQAMSEEYITRNWAYPLSFRLDLGKARSKSLADVMGEKKRFDDFLGSIARRPKAIITDSQAMDIMNQWCPVDIDLTTFSITMINYFSRGKLKLFYDGVKVMDKIKPGDKILIAEACNHSRIGEDIGLVQIPKFIEKNFPGVIVEHNFGREFRSDLDLSEFSLVIHCGGCMISSQALNGRLRDLESFGLPITNYGLFLSYMQGEEALKKVVKPWGL